MTNKKVSIEELKEENERLIIKIENLKRTIHILRDGSQQRINKMLLRKIEALKKLTYTKNKNRETK